MRLALRAGGVAVLLFTPGAALAHAPIRGLDSFYNGVLHPLFVPAHLLVLLVLGLLLGQQGPRENMAAILGFLAATLAGLATTVLLSDTGAGLPLLVCAMFCGLMVAAGRPMPSAAILLVAVICGLLIGLDSAQDHLGGREQFAMLFGSAVGIYLLLLYPMGLAEYLQRRQWQRIGVRVAGSWSAASALLVLTLTFTAPEHETGERATQPPLSVPVAAVAAGSAATRQ
jgi:hydrogenase/urease accessory protein HupE